MSACIKMPIPRVQSVSSVRGAVCRRSATHEGVVKARINTGDVDRYKTVIMPSGGRWEDFMRAGPAVLWEHGNDSTRGRLPIAKVLTMGRDQSGIVAEMRFAGDTFSQNLLDNYVDGTLRSFSVEFLPDKEGSGPPTREELRANPKWRDAHTIFRSWEMSGLSAVSYPGNASATILSIRGRRAGSGLPKNPTDQELADWVTEAITTHAPDFVERYVRAKADLAMNDSGWTFEQIDEHRRREKDKQVEAARTMVEEQRAKDRCVRDTQVFTFFGIRSS